ncbi:hypothetical protein XI07_04880 [Bradyrhizobium sp. CCBAU 11445]|nr:hypothetical protein [Bradyrhizobium sp. CCBAU 11445]
MKSMSGISNWLNYRMIESSLTRALTRAASWQLRWPFVRHRKRESAYASQSAVGNRQKQLLSVIHLLHHAEAEILELDLETPAVLLAAAITDLTQHLDSSA